MPPKLQRWGLAAWSGIRTALRGVGHALAWLWARLRPAMRRIRFRHVAAAVAIFLVLTIGFVGWSLLRLPVDGGITEDGGTSALALETADGDTFATRGGARGEEIEAARLPQPLADAVVAIEDRRFRDHGGLDLRAVARAGMRNIFAGRTREGGSTITQQLARLTYLSPERSFLRKSQEALIALWLERQLSKDEILARYLNSAYFGAGAWGADAAARRYFGKGAGELNLSEAAMLAGLVRAPTQLAPTRNLAAAQRRAEVVLGAMVETGHATDKDAEAALKAPAKLSVPPEMVADRGWFADWADAETRRQIGPLPVDLAARTTLDARMQDLATRTVQSWLDREGKRLNVGQAALVALANDGAVLAAVGGRDYTASQFNRVTQARRQPGSLFKLFVYGAAIDAGWRTDSPVMDEPFRVGNWEPQNFGERFRGPTTIRDAFAQSINAVAVKLSETSGRDKVIDLAHKLGIRAELPSVPSIALGAAEVPLIELTGAYASVATGRKVEPYLIRSIRSRDRAIFTRAESAGGPSPLSQNTRQQLLELLGASVRDGTGKAARLDRPVGGKTGTTSDYRDAWFIGFTPELIAGVWVGNDDNTPMKNVTGGELPARIWRDFMAEAVRQLPARAPEPRAVAASASDMQVPPLATPSALPADAVLRGRAAVVDSGTLRVEGQMVRLQGVIGFAGRPVREMTLYLAGREVECLPSRQQATFYRCSLDGRDLSEVVIFNGGGRASGDADDGLLRAEEMARAAGRGMWR